MGVWVEVENVSVKEKEGTLLPLRVKYFVGSMLIASTILAVGILLIYNEARSYLINDLSHEAVNIGR